MSSRAGRKRVRELHQPASKGSHGFERATVKRRLNQTSHVPSRAHTPNPEPKHKATNPPASDFTFRFVHDLANALPVPGLQTTLNGNTEATSNSTPAAHVIDEDLEDVVIHHPVRGKVVDRYTAMIHAEQTALGPE